MARHPTLPILGLMCLRTEFNRNIFNMGRVLGQGIWLAGVDRARPDCPPLV